MIVLDSYYCHRLLIESTGEGFVGEKNNRKETGWEMNLWSKVDLWFGMLATGFYFYAVTN